MAEKLPYIQDYLRSKKRFPTVWCPGCGIGIVAGGIIRGIDRLKLNKDEVAIVSGIGCTGRMPVYMDFNTVHTTHGRALAFATGLKLAKPSLKVIVLMGDGDALAIGGNHFIHACRRNLDLTAIIVNNNTYGMTGGQQSPTTLLGARSTNAPYGNIDQPFDTCFLAKAAGAAFVARTTTYHAGEMERLVARAISKKGFAVLEVLSQCPVFYGKMNRMPTAVEMMQWFRDNTSTQDVVGRIRRGVLVDREVPEYGDEYRKLVGSAQEQKDIRERKKSPATVRLAGPHEAVAVEHEESEKSAEVAKAVEVHGRK
ncbi:MAG: 2-oxoacid:ferredoxin oxidoreductase subunit beta [Chloroflexi bacterium]|nr:2-oxoacid:ferredoxin oxidoreductase subunit beta [Chloroflexota bacterium]